MKNLLFVSIAFPPKSDPECLQTAKYYYYLQKHSALNIEVLTSAVPTLFMPVDKQLERFDIGYKNKVEISIPENKYVNFLMRKLQGEKFDRPDSKKAFFKKWKKAVQRIQTKPDIIYSRSFPLSSTLMALKLKEHYNVPWVLHLSDPWVESPIHNYSEISLAYHKGLEKQCFDKASAICFTSEMTIELYKTIYPELGHKFHYFPNVYDNEELKDNPYTFSDKIKVVYTGGLVGPRNISYLLAALQELKSKAPELLEIFDFVFAGAMDSRSAELFASCSFKNVRHIGLLSYADALELQRSADILLVIDNPIDNPKAAVFFPSKILDYLLAKRKIVAITTLGGTTHKVLSTLEGISCAHNDMAALTETLMEIAKAFIEKKLDYFYYSNEPKTYAADYNAERLKDLLISIE